MPRSKRPDRVDHQRAAKLLRDEWKAVVGVAELKPAVSFIFELPFVQSSHE
jgi:hypothetical protein